MKKGSSDAHVLYGCRVEKRGVECAVHAGDEQRSGKCMLPPSYSLRIGTIGGKDRGNVSRRDIRL